MDLFRLTIILFIVAALLRNELFFYLLYVIVGLQVVAHFWLKKTTQQLRWKRQAPPAAFPGEQATVELQLENQSLLPTPWVALHESIPPALHTPPMLRQVVSLGAKQQITVSYTLIARRRGFYRLGPLVLRTGDVLGLGERTLEDPQQLPFVVYPTIRSLPELGLPATLPYGTVAAQRRLFADPARPAGVRPYQSSDGVRQIDWKSSAHANTPLVRRFQPAIALETMIGVAFSRSEYGDRFDYDTMERALTAAASLAVALSNQRQPVGLCATGHDPLLGSGLNTQAPAQGRAHLMALLNALGRMEPTQQGDLTHVAQQAAARLGWGATLVLITGQRGNQLLSGLLPLRRAGLNLALIITEATPEDLALPRRHGIASYGLWRDGLPSKR